MTIEQQAYYRARYDNYLWEARFFPHRCRQLAWEDAVRQWPELANERAPMNISEVATS